MGIRTVRRSNVNIWHQTYGKPELGLYLTIQTTEACLCIRKQNRKCPLGETLLELRVTTETNEHW